MCTKFIMSSDQKWISICNRMRWCLIYFSYILSLISPKMLYSCCLSFHAIHIHMYVFREFQNDFFFHFFSFCRFSFWDITDLFSDSFVFDLLQLLAIMAATRCHTFATKHFWWHIWCFMKKYISKIYGEFIVAFVGVVIPLMLSLLSFCLSDFLFLHELFLWSGFSCLLLFFYLF